MDEFGKKRVLFNFKYSCFYDQGSQVGSIIFIENILDISLVYVFDLPRIHTYEIQLKLLNRSQESASRRNLSKLTFRNISV